MIVCICNSVNDRQVRRAIAEGHDTLEELQLELGVATRCGKCVEATCSLIAAARCTARCTETPVFCAPFCGPSGRRTGAPASGETASALA
jgi:bacterioferritin-associated ferredoxin